MTTETQEEVKTETAPAEVVGEQIPLIPDEITEEQETREVLIPLQPHEVLQLVDRMSALNEELKGHKADEEKEKTRHKEAKEAISGRISTTTENISKLIDEAGMRKRKSLEKTTKRINHTSKMVEWIWNGQVVDSRPMVAAEFQLKLLPDEQPDNVVAINSEEEAEQEGDAAGTDPATFEEGEPANVEDFDRAAGEISGEDQELGENVVDEDEQA